MEKIKKLAESQTKKWHETGCDTSEFIGFESESGQWIINPFLSEDEMQDVDPVEYYGEDFLNSDFCKIISDEQKENIKICGGCLEDGSKCSKANENCECCFSFNCGGDIIE